MNETRSLKRRLNVPSARNAVVFGAIALIPLIYAGLLTAANADPTHQLDNVPAAVVNEDTGAVDARGASLDLGDSVTEELTSSSSSSNFTWTLMDADDARQQLTSGAISAILTIPAGFSSDVASVGADVPSDATTATLSMETNDASNLIIGSIASTIGASVTRALSQQVGETYLQSVYVGFTDLHNSLELAVDGADQLDAGAVAAASGTAELLVGLTQLQAGTAELSRGAAELSSGAGSAAAGASSLAAGLGTLADKTAQLPTQARLLNSGARQVADGAQQAQIGADAVASGAATLASSTPALAAGAAAAATGAHTLSTGASAVATGAQTALDAASRLAEAIRSLSEGVTSSATGAAAVSTGLQDLLDAYPTLSDEQRIEILAELQARAAEVAGAVEAVSSGSQDLANAAQALVGDDTAGLAALTAAADRVAGGAASVDAANGSLADGAAGVDAGASALSTGAASLATASKSLADGSAQVAGGAQTLAEQSDPLTTGILDASAGADVLADGTADLATGATQLVSGAAAADTGAASAATGSQTLASGLDELAAGLGNLAGQLADGAAQTPSYTEAESTALAAVASEPVALNAERMNEVPAYGYGLAPYFLALALWVGALGFYLMSAPLSARLLASRRPAWWIALRSFLPGAVMGVVQGLLAALVIRFGVGIEVVDLPAFIGIAVLTSVTFIAINQALIALLDAPGRFLALIFIVLQLSASGGTYPIETAPVFFQVIHGALPLTHALEAFRSLIAGGSIGVVGAVISLSCWLVGALVLTIVAVARRERRPNAFTPADLVVTA